MNEALVHMDLWDSYIAGRKAAVHSSSRNADQCHRDHVVEAVTRSASSSFCASFRSYATAQPPFASMTKVRGTLPCAELSVLRAISAATVWKTNASGYPWLHDEANFLSFGTHTSLTETSPRRSSPRVSSTCRTLECAFMLQKTAPPTPLPHWSLRWPCLLRACCCSWQICDFRGQPPLLPHFPCTVNDGLLVTALVVFAGHAFICLLPIAKHFPTGVHEFPSVDTGWRFT